MTAGDVQVAAARAVDFLRSLPETGPIHDLRVEEVELTEDGRHWLITLGYANNPVSLADRRQYKQFKVSAASGEVESMKIRTVA